MKRNEPVRLVKLGPNWRTGDGSANAGKELFKILGPQAAMIYWVPKMPGLPGLWFVVRYLNPRDEYRTNHLGQQVKTLPWRRALEVVGAGRTPDECLWQLRGGTCRAMVGKGFRPVRRGDDWIGFTDGETGLPVQGGKVLDLMDRTVPPTRPA